MEINNQKHIKRADSAGISLSSLAKPFHKYIVPTLLIIILAICFSSCKTCKCPAYSDHYISDKNLAEPQNS